MRNIIQFLIQPFFVFLVVVTTITAKNVSLVEYQDNNVTATINKETTDEQFEDLKAYFVKHDIVIKVTHISRNTNNEIVGLNITISKGDQQTSYQMNSNMPISNIELGYKEGNVFIDSTAHNLSATFGNRNSLSSILKGLNHGGNSLDSLLSKNKFSFSFGSDDLQKFLNESSFNFDQMQDEFFNQFFNSDHPFFSGKRQLNPPSSAKKPSSSALPKYSFFSSKKNNKLIIINGKESNFEALNDLAQKNELIDVDHLKPSTAISIYGAKAKHGAIIATTK